MKYKERLLKNRFPENVDILFIVPPVLRFMEKSSNHLPLGLGYMVSYLKQNNIHSKIYNADTYQVGQMNAFLTKVRHYLKTKLSGTTSYNIDSSKKWLAFDSKLHDLNSQVWNEVRSVLKEVNPPIVGITSKVVDIPSTFIFADIVKEVLPDASVIVGGPSAITCSDYLMQNRSIDFLVLGEGEETILQLASHLLSGSDRADPKRIQGILYRSDDGVLITTAPRPLIQDLDKIPFPEREAMFVIDTNGKVRYIYECGDLLTSRGCPYPCRFCCAYKAWGEREPRLRSADNFIEELKHLYSAFDRRDFVFWDDMFTVNRKRTIEICEKIMENMPDIRWVCVTRLNALDAELLDIMKRAGCYEVQVGIESGNNRILKHIKKGLTLQMIQKQIHLIRKAGIKWLGFFIIGFPSETKEEIGYTLNLISELKPDYAYLGVFCPYPGTDFYFDLKKNGSIGENFIKSDMLNPFKNFTGTMNDDEFKEIALNAFRFVDRFNTKH